MKLRTLNETWETTLSHLDEETQRLVRETPHVHFDPDSIPAELDFLRGEVVDLGIEDLGVSRDVMAALFKGLTGHGIVIPGTRYKIRRTAGPMTVIEPNDDSAEEALPVLPDHWRSVVTVLSGNRFTWVGEKVRPDRVGPIDYMRKVPGGWLANPLDVRARTAMAR